MSDNIYLRLKSFQLRCQITSLYNNGTQNNGCRSGSGKHIGYLRLFHRFLHSLIRRFLERKQVFDEVEEQALLLFNSEMNAALMRLPVGQVAIESKKPEDLLVG